MLVAELAQRDRFETIQGIPVQRRRFAPHAGHVPGQVGRTAYGVRHNSDGAGSFEYLCGVEVVSFAELADEFARVRIPKRRYAVFSHRAQISAISATICMIWSTYLPQSGLEVADAPDFERFGVEFDPQTGTGWVEIWMPIKG